jgi:glutathione S-transferase
MIRLTQMPRVPGIPNLSPPCMKLETWLRMTGLAYELAPFDMSRAPKGKVPYFELDGGVHSDATLALDVLSARFGVDPDARLSPLDRATGLALRRMLKEHFYWVIVYFRWHADTAFAAFSPIIGACLPPGVPDVARRQFLEGARANLLDQLQKQGTGRHAPDEVARLGVEELDACATLLGDRPFFFGDAPTTLDATVYAAVASVIDVAIESPVKEHALGLANLVAHTRRMTDRFFPEYAG